MSAAQRVVIPLTYAFLALSLCACTASSAVQNQTVTAADMRRPLRLKLFCPGRKLRPALVGKPQIVRGEREFFETDEM